MLLARAYLAKQQRPIYSISTPGGILAVAPAGWAEIGSPTTVLPAAPQMLPRLLTGVSHSKGGKLPQLLNCHVMVVGAQGDGKSNTLKALAQQRMGVTVIDPHYRPGTWPPHVNIISTKDSIRTALLEMDTVLDDRIAGGRAGELAFNNRTIVVDELPVLANSLGSDLVWGAFKRWLFEARKYKLFLILGTHTTQVKPLGLEGQSVVFQMIKATILLGGAAVRKDPELVRGMERPAILQIEQQPPQPLLIPYNESLDPESARFTAPAATQPPQHERDAAVFNSAPLSDLTSRNRAALYLAGRDHGRASGGEYERLDAALRYRAQAMNCTWAHGLQQGA